MAVVFWRPDGSRRGPEGESGERGPNTIGPAGEDIQGPPGLMPRHQWLGTRIRFETEFGWGPWVDLKGPKGPPG